MLPAAFLVVLLQPHALVDPTAVAVARAFAQSVADADAVASSALCATPMNVDGEILADRAALERRMAAVLSTRRLERRYPVSVTVLHAAEARRRYGPPPRRISAAVAADSLVALVRLPPGRSGYVVVLRRVQGFWRVVAVTA